MSRRARQSLGGANVNIETHQCNEAILPQFRTTLSDLHFVRDNMPAPEMLYEPRHGWQHSLYMLVYASVLCEYNRFDAESVRWAILTHDCGRYSDHMQESQHPLMSAYVFDRMAEKVPLRVDADLVSEIVRRHNLTDAPLSTEESILRTCDRLDLWRIPDFPGIDAKLVAAPGWQKVEKMAKRMRLEGKLYES